MNDGAQGMSTMLHEAAASKNSACVRLLLASPLLAPHALQMVDEVGYIHCTTISHRALFLGLQELTLCPATKVSHTCHICKLQCGWTPLHDAVYVGDVVSATMLLMAGADVNVVTEVRMRATKCSPTC
jgi:hypothetical protein